MAKQLAKNVGAVGKDAYTLPSRFGSHASMVISENEDGTVICKDEYGEYKTTKDRLDDKLADPNRYSATSRVVKVKEDVQSITAQFGPGAVWVPEKISS